MHGSPDNSQVQQRFVTYTLNDMAELAIRLGAVPSLDRTGEVFFFDNFSNGDGNWTKTLSGLGGGIIISGDNYRTSGFSLELTGGSNLNKQAFIETVQAYFQARKIGSEINISFDSNVNRMKLYIVYYDNTYYQYVELLLDITNGKLYIYPDPGIAIELASGLTFDDDVKHFYNLKIVIDMSTGEYMRLFYNGTPYNVLNYFVQTVVGDYIPRVEFDLEVLSNAGSNGIAYLDSVILTQNEV